MNLIAGILLLVAACSLRRSSAIAAATSSDDDARRQAAIAEFTARTKAANYPVLFDQSAQEFGVPADILKGIAFAETRWEHLTWPPGETVSPETGMPRPYGIMSLWDNNYFGHSLIDAAGLVGKSSEELKADPLQNIRGAAALLRKLYDENPKPADAPDAGILESWRYAIRKYCGIPEPDLNARHALKVYTFIAQGYHQFGIEWDGHAVALKPIQEETKRIVDLEEQKRVAARASSAKPTSPAAAASTSLTTNAPASPQNSAIAHSTNSTTYAVNTINVSASVIHLKLPLIVAGVLILLAFAAAAIFVLIRIIKSMR